MSDKLPAFPDCRPIAHEDAELFNALFAEEQPMISEFTFTNLFVWRNRYNLQACECDEGVFLLAKPEGELMIDSNAAWCTATTSRVPPLRRCVGRSRPLCRTCS